MRLGLTCLRVARQLALRLMVKSISELASDASTDSGTESENMQSSSDKLESLCDSIGADFEHAQLYIDEHGSKQKLIDMAKYVRDNPEEAHEVAENYRRMVSLKSIVQNYLYNSDAEFETWLNTFWGDSDDPDEGTFNYWQQKARDTLPEGVVMVYKALFPEPVEAYWESEPVLWEEADIGYSDGQRDTHIYVTEDFATEYSEYTLDDGRPRPPSDSELSGAGGSSTDSDESRSSADSDTSESSSDLDIDLSQIDVSDAPFNPASVSVDTLKSRLKDNDYSEEQLRSLHGAEQLLDDRKTAKQAIEREMPSDADSDDDDKETPAEFAGRIMSETGSDADPEIVKSMYENGMSEEQIKAAI